MVTHCVCVTSKFNTTAFNQHTTVFIRDLLGFSQQLYKWSQLDEILNRAKHATPDLVTKLDALLIQLEEINSEISEPLPFLKEQLQLSLLDIHGRRYSPQLTHYAIEIYLSSRNSYRIISQHLSLPCSRTLYAHIGRVCEVGDNSECDRTISSAMHSFIGLQKQCLVLFDEMYVKPSIRFRGGHLLGYSVDDPSQMARTILAIMIRPMMGAPAFVCRLLPINKLSSKFLFKTLSSVIHCVHRHGGKVMGLMSDNHPTNRSCYAQFTGDEACEKWMGKNPATGELLYLLVDTVHLMKSVRNNWLSEKCKYLKCTFNQETSIGRWTDIRALFNKEKDNIVKRTTLSYQSCYPSNLDLQKVSLFTTVFNEKTVYALKQDGSLETATVLDHFTRLWKILNIKTTVAHLHLNDPDRKQLEDKKDSRFSFLISTASMVAQMSGGKGNNRVASLTSETRDALSQTLRGLVHLWQEMLSIGHRYILTGIFQSDRLEGEFGIYR
jgi:hypothetical protein